MNDLNDLPNEELDRIAATEIMGWTFFADPDGIASRWRKYGKYIRFDWHPSTDHNDMSLVRAEIRRKGLEADYASHLYDLIAESIPETKDYAKNDDLVLWCIDDAPLRDKLISAILAVMEAKK